MKLLGLYVQALESFCIMASDPKHTVGGMSYTKDEAVLTARALAAGLDVSLVEKIQAAGVTTIAKVAFCSSYLPGSADESPMVEAFKCAIGRALCSAN